MKFWKKLSLVAFISIAVFLIQGIVNTPSARADLYKFSFNNNRVNGYFVFDDSIPGKVFVRPDLFNNAFNEYDASVVEYNINIEDEIVEKGSKNPDTTIDDHDRARTIVNRVRPEFVPIFYKADPNITLDGSNEDEFVLFIPKNERQSELSLTIRFRYPPEIFSDSLAQPKIVPSKALMSVHPYWNFPKSMGPVEFEQEVNTSIEKIDEPLAPVALLSENN
ncbi:MAG: hypothetical protein QNJ41_01750 [Xenococcaceae cyanobacterium MO_188.B32]|nr:hypothetical protein [Xenococcaceae cyanobacterium MO_188.B32]